MGEFGSVAIEPSLLGVADGVIDFDNPGDGSRNPSSHQASVADLDLDMDSIILQAVGIKCPLVLADAAVGQFKQSAFDASGLGTIPVGEQDGADGAGGEVFVKHGLRCASA